MAFGYIARNTENNVLVSDQTFNCVFAGKASFEYQYTAIGTGANLYPGASVTNQCRINRYSFDSGGKEVVPFVHSPSNNWTGFAYYQRSGNFYTFYVLSQGGEVPVIYCFTKSSSLGKSGWGMSTFDSAGNTTFTTGDNILQVKGIYNALTDNSSVDYTNWVNSYLYLPRTNASVVYNAPLNTISSAISKPAIMYFSYGTATCFKSGYSNSMYWESCAKFDFATNNILTYWAIVAPLAGANIQTPAHYDLALLIDGADYD